MLEAAAIGVELEAKILAPPLSPQEQPEAVAMMVTTHVDKLHAIGRLLDSHCRP